MSKIVKGKKIRCFYAETVREKPTKTHTRHFIHSKDSGGFWAHIRDLSQREKLANESVGHQTVVQIIVGYNPKILDMWERLTIIDEKGVSYTIREKPDEFEYAKEDLKITAYAFRDEKDYTEDTYDG
ncbi:MAG: head-tail adaptor protein [Christensenellaceae bacterium]